MHRGRDDPQIMRAVGAEAPTSIWVSTWALEVGDDDCTRIDAGISKFLLRGLPRLPCTDPSQASLDGSLRRNTRRPEFTSWPHFPLRDEHRVRLSIIRSRHPRISYEPPLLIILPSHQAVLCIFFALARRTVKTINDPAASKTGLFRHLFYPIINGFWHTSPVKA